MTRQILDKYTQIDLPLIDRPHRRDSHATECYLRLFDNYIEYKVVATYEADDSENMPGVWTSTTCNYRWVKLRSDISEITMLFDNPSEQWNVCIDFSGSDSIGWHYSSPKDALKLYNQLHEYFIMRP